MASDRQASQTVELTEGEACLLLGLLTNPDLAFTDIEYVDALKAKLGDVMNPRTLLLSTEGTDMEDKDKRKALDVLLSIVEDESVDLPSRIRAASEILNRPIHDFEAPVRAI